MLTSTKNLIASLIGEGADAATNLFQVEFVFTVTGLDTSEIPTRMSIRTTQFTMPEPAVHTQAIPYFNTTINIPTFGQQLDRTLNLTIREDEDWAVLSFLRDKLLTDENGDYDRIDNYNDANSGEAYMTSNRVYNRKTCDIYVYAFKQTSDTAVGTAFTNRIRSWANISTEATNLEKVLQYTFYDCVLTRISAVQFDYASAGQASHQLTFVYSRYDETFS